MASIARMNLKLYENYKKTANKSKSAEAAWLSRRLLTVTSEGIHHQT